MTLFSLFQDMTSSYIPKRNRGNEQGQGTCFKLRFDEVEENSSRLKELHEEDFQLTTCFKIVSQFLFSPLLLVLCF